MKPLVYTLNRDEHGKIIMSEDDFKRVLDEVYEAGYNDGNRQCKILYPSTIENPLTNTQHEWLNNTPIKCRQGITTANDTINYQAVYEKL